MRIAEINYTLNGSTGTIMRNVSSKFREDGHDVHVFIPKSRTNLRVRNNEDIIFGTITERLFGIVLARLIGYDGFSHVFSTLSLVRKLRRFSPDIVHIHNLHLTYVNIPLLSSFIKKHGIRVIWTFHDCWPLTGHCPHFILSRCEKWQHGCYSCPSYKEYPKSLVDDSKRMFKLKKRCFGGMSNLHIVTPSEWLKGCVSRSFLKSKRCYVINNGIDLSVFSPKESDFREKYNIGTKLLILGVSSNWGYKKGLDTFVKLREDLPENDYAIVLVGVSSKLASEIPSSIICIERTSDACQLAKIYSSADVFCNPTREDNFPTVNIEALACGTPVVTYSVGGSAEIIDETCGAAVEPENYHTLLSILADKERLKRFDKTSCVLRATRYSIDQMAGEYSILLNSV